METIYISRNPRRNKWTRLVKRGDVKKLTVDLTMWAQDVGDVTSVTPSIESGQASIGTVTLSDNVWSAPVTFSQEGYSMIKLIVTDGTETEAVYVEVRCVEPSTVEYTDDYGILR